jgi:hypothetical protein
MTRLHEGLDYKLYKIYIWGGLALLAAHILAVGFLYEAHGRPTRELFVLVIIPIVLYLGGILLYWWWVFLFKGNRELESWTQAPEGEVPPISALKSWSTLHQAMAIYGGNVDELVKNAKRARWPVILWYGSANLLVLWIVCPVALGSLEMIQGGQVTLMIWLAGVFVWIAVMLVGTPFLLSWGSRRSEMAYLAPLGLALTTTPELEADRIGLLAEDQMPYLDGAFVLEGERHGRLVHIETVGKHSLTLLQGGMPAFTVRSNNGKLVPDAEAPEAVAKALKSLRKAKRWRGIVVHAGPEGTGIQRESRGTNMWLYDLWLAEYLCEAAADD